MRDFKHSMDVLIKAYMNDTLQHGNCHACAVGNLVADACGLKYETSTTCMINLELNFGSSLIISRNTHGEITGGNWFMCPDASTAEEQRQAIGYTRGEVRQIEQAFECCSRGNSNDEWMFNGLVAVLDVLAEIHGVDLSTKKEYKEQLEAVFAS